MTKKLDEIIAMPPKDATAELKKTPTNFQSWERLKKQYDPNEHDVMDKGKYPDIIIENEPIQYVTRIALDLQRLAVKRTTELCFGVPVKRIYKAQTDGEKEVAKAIEAILQRNRIDSVNIERGNMLFASCQTATIWFATKEQNTLYGFDSSLKLRCRSYSPMNGDSIYPLFDAETNDMIALSFGYIRKNDDKDVEYLDVYTADKHIRYKNDGEWTKELYEQSVIGKIPAVYCCRPKSAWEDTTNIVSEIEWALSRNGNYLRNNSRPYLAVFADEELMFNKAPIGEQHSKDVGQYPIGADVRYITWEQAVENLKFYVGELRQSFFTQLQLPDWSYESMKTTPMSGEARKQMFIDAQLKVKDESGRLLEMIDREINVIKAFLKIMMPAKSKDIDNLQVESVITPFTISDEKETISNIMTATGGKPIVSQREGIEVLGWSSDTDKTLEEITNEEKLEVFNLTE
jgi:hypothetical protein